MCAVPGVVMLIVVECERLTTREHQQTKQKRRRTRIRPAQERPPKLNDAPVIVAHPLWKLSRGFASMAKKELQTLVPVRWIAVTLV
jgi:hypothetical protein